MRLATYLRDGEERLGLIRDELIVDVERVMPGGPSTIGQLLEGGPPALEALRVAWEEPDVNLAEAAVPVSSVRLLSPVPRPGKIVAIGLNYHSHAQEQGREAPDRPIVFAKFSTAVIGPGETIEWDPGLTEAVDFEAELAVVMGRRARHVSEADALDHVLGYTCLNDVSARDLQYSDKQFVRSKSLDTFCPIGPALVTRDEIPDAQALAIRCVVSGETLQESSTADMVFSVAQLIAFCSRAFTLEPGDVIATGTPAGVGYFREPRRMLRDGDEVVIEIEGIGRLVNGCREVSR